MKRISRSLVSVTAALSLGLGGAAVAVQPADAAVWPHRVKMVGNYGHLVVYGKHGKRMNLWPGSMTPSWIDATTVYAVGEGRCRGVLWWKRLGPDKKMGGGGKVKKHKVTVYVKRGSCS